ncbi:flavocytochrome c [Treponema phagedenis F0421]|uniref:flavocytochrome c n=1 Tax=Treponema phagedenis TaxID=162 RepID=UPI0001F63D3D|nr:flavocytochrome c [Treponema phagedenis]EFW37386.1 flavocytochrome c [Treponema phagedenis F0421]
MKKFATVLLGVMLIIGFSGCSQKESGESTGGIKNGTYTSTVKGNNAEITLEVQVKDSKIESAKVTNHSETPVLSDGAINDIHAQVVETQSLAIDTISGATVSSTAVLLGIENCLTEAGFSIDDLKAKKGEIKKEEDKTIDTDVLVIGAGGAGLSAAVTANQEGAKVVVVEKMPKVGGNTILAGGALNAVDEGSETAKKHKDSVELHFKQTYEGGNKKGDPKLVRILVNNAYSAIKWLKDLGMEFKPDTFTVLGGLWPRAHKPVEPVGTGFFKTFNNYITTHENIEVLLETKAEELIITDGVVKGIIASGKTGNKITINAKNVIIATGGFSKNIEMRQKYNTLWENLGENIKSTNHPGATGDGITLGLQANADLVGMEYIQLLPMGDPKTGSLSGNIEMAVENRIFVNKEGKRFVDEGARRDVMTAALMQQQDSQLWVIVDSHDYPTGEEVNNFNEKLNDLIKEGRAFKGDSLNDLAKAINVNPENLNKAVESFNKFVRGEIKDEFGRTLKDREINKGPFYAALRVPTVHHTMGGLKINENAEVIDKNGNVINHLYAAGEVTGGIHGENRLGGNALADIIVFGRIAGKNAAANK